MSKNGVNDGARTHDHQSHNLVLCQLSYVHHEISTSPILPTLVSVRQDTSVYSPSTWQTPE